MRNRISVLNKLICFDIRVRVSVGDLCGWCAQWWTGWCWWTVAVWIPSLWQWCRLHQCHRMMWIDRSILRYTFYNLFDIIQLLRSLVAANIFYSVWWSDYDIVEYYDIRTHPRDLYQSSRKLQLIFASHQLKRYSFVC